MVRYTQVVKAKPGSVQAPRRQPAMLATVYQKPRFKSLTNPVLSTAPEKKNLDINQASPVVAAQTTATVALLNGSGIGSDDFNHVGRKTLMKSIQWRFTGHLAPTTTGSSAIRMLIIYDKQANGVAPTTTQVVVADSIENPMQLDYSERFVVLVDEIIECVGTQGPQAFYTKGYRKINLPCEFIGTGGTITSIGTGSIYSYVWQDGGLITASPATQLYTRIRFIDV